MMEEVKALESDSRIKSMKNSKNSLTGVETIEKLT